MHIIRSFTFCMKCSHHSRSVSHLHFCLRWFTLFRILHSEHTLHTHSLTMAAFVPLHCHYNISICNENNGCGDGNDGDDDDNSNDDDDAYSSISRCIASHMCDCITPYDCWNFCCTDDVKYEQHTARGTTHFGTE